MSDLQDSLNAALEGFSRECREFANPTIDQLLAGARDFLAQAGVAPTTQREARIALSFIMIYESIPEEVKSLLTMYLGNLLEGANRN